MPRKVILIGIDGGTCRVLDPLMLDGVMPNFSQLTSEGVYGVLNAPLPPNTASGWNSIFTGVNPGKHGMPDFILYEGGQFVIARTKHRMCDSLWKIVGRRGLKCIVVNDPVTFPPEPINGIMTTGFLTPPYSSDYVYPPELKKEINKVADGYLPEVQQPLMLTKSKEAALDLIDDYATKLAKTGFHLASNYEWDVLAVIFTSTDRLQHRFWGDVPSLRRHYRLLDQYIGKFMDLAASENANIIVVSDHGFGPCRRAMYINTWLAQQGYLKVYEKKISRILRKLGITRKRILRIPGVLKLVRMGAIHKIPRNIRHTIPLRPEVVGTVDWNGSLAYQPSTSGIFLNEAILGNGLQEFRTELIDTLTSLTDPETGTPVVRKCFPREEVYWGPYTYRAPHIIVLPYEGYHIMPKITEFVFGAPLVRGIFPVTGNHRVEGIVAAGGPDIKRGLRFQGHKISWDIAPTILHLLGLPILSYMDGQVMKDLFAEGSDAATRAVKREAGLRELISLKARKLRF